MKKDGQNLPEVNPIAKKIIRSASLLAPLLLFLYGLLAVTHLIDINHRIVVPAFYAISIGWLLLIAYSYFVPSKHKYDIGLRVILFHSLAIAYILFVSGIAMPLTGLWILLFLAAYMYFGKSGLYLSILSLFGVTLGESLQQLGDINYLVQVILYSTGTVIVGFIAGAMHAAQEVDRRELIRSQDEEAAQRDRVLTIVNNLADAIFSTDRDGIIQIYNAASLNLLDTNSGLAGQHIDSVIRMTDPENKIFKLQRAFRTSHSVVTRDDLSAVISEETIRLNVIYSPIRSTNSSDLHENDGYVVILRDITKQKSLEDERDEFISVVSHELRTPITIAEGSLSNVDLMMHRKDIPHATLIKNVETAHDQILFLARMVNDLSTLSRAERGVADEVETLDINQIINALYNEYAPQAEAKGLKFNLDVPAKAGSVSSSPLYLKEFLQNFVTNAIKYTKKGSVTISVEVANSQVTFSIEDTGIGISKSDQVKIFEKFWRSEDYRTRETGGTGLGLYVATKLADKLDTRIDTKSRINHGSTFSFSLPMAEPVKDD